MEKVKKNDGKPRKKSREKSQIRQAPKARGEDAPAPQLSHIDEPFAILVILLLAVGVICLYSASYSVAMHRRADGNATHFALRQAQFAVAGIVAMFLISRFNYHKLHYFAVPGMVLSYVLLISRYVTPFLWKKVNGAMRWFRYPLEWQPSELTKFVIILFFASMITILGPKKMRTMKYGVLPFMAVLSTTAALLVFQPHLSGTVIVLAVGIILMFLGGVRLGWLVGGGLAAVMGGTVFVLNTSYAMERINVWLDPFIDAMGDGWQGVQSLLAIGSGGFWGLGLGQSRQKHLFLPEPANDFIFPVICEELGFVGATLIIIVFAALIWRGYYIAMHAGDKFGTLLAAGITTQIAVQVILNLGVVTGLFPVTGVSLPFFSYGGTSLLMLMGEVGLLLSISRRMPAPKEG